MRERLRNGGIEVTGFDRNPDVTDVATVDEIIAALPARASSGSWSPPARLPTPSITELGGKLDAGDLVIDGGNSRFTEDQKHVRPWPKRESASSTAAFPAASGACQNGYGLMAGGDAEDIERRMPVFDAFRPEGEREESFVQWAASARATTPKWCTTASNTA